MKNVALAVAISWRLAVASTLPSVEEAAVAPDPVAAQSAIAALRARGQEGLDAFWRAHERDLSRLRAGAVPSSEDARLLLTLDAIARQKDALYARLFWYTDLDAARAAARAGGRPILSLRLLGNLDEELSCANGRFFRTILYADPEVADVLRSCFVLHWKSVRPVPKVTIDFGDGRVLKQTISGNSVHYVLDADGQPVDALPGVYAPGVFLERLERAGEIARQLAGLPRADKEARLREYHGMRLAALGRAWKDEIRKLAREDGEPEEAAVTIAAHTIESEERHAAIDGWFATGPVPADADGLNARVSAELYLASIDDPWLGMASRDVYTALPEPSAAAPGKSASGSGDRQRTQRRSVASAR
ncbi:MAG: hypothetical protein U0166_22465 [Acidobacteriota bacterium]